VLRMCSCLGVFSNTKSSSNVPAPITTTDMGKGNLFTARISLSVGMRTTSTLERERQRIGEICNLQAKEF
jgi:hypothetical protein